MWTTARIALALGGTLLLTTACGGSSRTAERPEPREVDGGYDTRDADEVTGSVTSIAGESLGRARPMRIEELLRGRVPGLQVVNMPGIGMAFRIRGTNSLQNEQPALVIVDGVHIAPNSLSSALAGLLPDDIKQVDVLRDVASTSIYGNRGAGGVILIKTRH